MQPSTGTHQKPYAKKVSLAGPSRPRAIIVSPAHGLGSYYRPKCLGRAKPSFGNTTSHNLLNGGLQFGVFRAVVKFRVFSKLSHRKVFLAVRNDSSNFMADMGSVVSTHWGSAFIWFYLCHLHRFSFQTSSKLVSMRPECIMPYVY